MPSLMLQTHRIIVVVDVVVEGGEAAVTVTACWRRLLRDTISRMRVCVPAKCVRSAAIQSINLRDFDALRQYYAGLDRHGARSPPGEAMGTSAMAAGHEAACIYVWGPRAAAGRPTAIQLLASTNGARGRWKNRRTIHQSSARAARGSPHPHIPVAHRSNYGERWNATAGLPPVEAC